MDQEIYVPVLTALFSGGISYYVANVIHKFDKSYKRKEKALEMANEFSKLISTRSFDVGEVNKKVLENIGLQNKIKELEDKEYLNFDFDELNEIFNEKEYKKYHDYKNLGNLDFIKVLFETFRNETTLDECLSSIIRKLDSQKSLDENIEGKQWRFKLSDGELCIESNDVKQGVNEMGKKYSEIGVYSKNKLEWFAMHFTNNIADESTVYQSLHQIYLKTVISQYLDISENNKRGHEKFYINVIGLYNQWNRKEI